MNEEAATAILDEIQRTLDTRLVQTVPALVLLHRIRHLASRRCPYESWWSDVEYNSARVAASQRVTHDDANAAGNEPEADPGTSS